jgi:hypothetical protein
MNINNELLAQLLSIQQVPAQSRPHLSQLCETIPDCEWHFPSLEEVSAEGALALASGKWAQVQGGASFATFCTS